MVEVEVFGSRTGPGGAGSARRMRSSTVGLIPSIAEVRRLCLMAAGSAGVGDGHMAIEFVDAERIAELNWKHRGEPTPTDVLAFPIDGVDPLDEDERAGEAERVAGRERSTAERSTAERSEAGGQRELGDVVICPEYTVDLREAVIHGVLHLVGMDHETDDGEMLALQRELLARASP
jgi:probable rRNA maturation factor